MGDYVKMVWGLFKGYYVIVHSPSYGDDVKVQYLKKCFGKYVLKELDFDSRPLHEMKQVTAEIDNRGRCTFSDSSFLLWMFYDCNCCAMLLSCIDFSFDSWRLFC